MQETCNRYELLLEKQQATMEELQPALSKARKGIEHYKKAADKVSNGYDENEYSRGSTVMGDFHSNNTTIQTSQHYCSPHNYDISNVNIGLMMVYLM
jgi:hypothetical protein